MTEGLFGLSGKVAIVTGAGSGLGRETASLLHRLGAQVIATDIDAAAVEAAADAIGPGVTALRHDVTNENDWAGITAHVEAHGDRLDILVNNAGIMLSRPFVDAPPEMLRRQFTINVESVYVGMQTAIPLLSRSIAAGASSTSIVNIASIYGKIAGAQYAAYSATKGAVRALSKAVAFELAKTGIRVNTVLPGPVATNLGANWDPPRDADGNLIPPEQALAAWTSLIPMGRLGEASDVASLVAFLASDAARFITGAEFITDGGYTAA